VLIWPARAHLVHQPIEVCAAAWVDQAQLAINNCCLCWELGESLGHGRQAIRVFGTALGVEPNPAAILDGLEPKAVPFGFVQPIIAHGWAGNSGGGEGTAERKARHRPLCSLLMRRGLKEWFGRRASRTRQPQG
jgi:hypothetical protein